MHRNIYDNTAPLCYMLLEDVWFVVYIRMYAQNVTNDKHWRICSRWV